MIDIESVRTSVPVTVRVKLNGAPPLKASYSDRLFLPDYVKLRYAVSRVEGEAVWSCEDRDVSGPRILKPADDGSMRLGKDRCTRTFYSTYELVPWLAQLIDELRPSGLPDLPGDLA